MKLATVLLLGTLQSFPLRTAESEIATNISLDLGSVSVYLGMGKTELMKKLSAQSYKASEKDNTIEAMNAGHVYTIRFRSGQLVYADRAWTNPELIDATLGALGSVAKHDTNACNLLHLPISDPDLTADRFFIVCGQRNLLIGKMKIGQNVGASLIEKYW